MEMKQNKKNVLIQYIKKNLEKLSLNKNSFEKQNYIEMIEDSKKLQIILKIKI